MMSETSMVGTDDRPEPLGMSRLEEALRPGLNGMNREDLEILNNNLLSITKFFNTKKVMPFSVMWENGGGVDFVGKRRVGVEYRDNSFTVAYNSSLAYYSEDDELNNTNRVFFRTFSRRPVECGIGVYTGEFVPSRTRNLNRLCGITVGAGVGFGVAAGSGMGSGVPPGLWVSAGSVLAVIGALFGTDWVTSNLKSKNDELFEKANNTILVPFDYTQDCLVSILYQDPRTIKEVLTYAFDVPYAIKDAFEQASNDYSKCYKTPLKLSDLSKVPQ